MLSRRDFLIAAAVVRTTGLIQREAPKSGFDVPSGACDCHTHIFGDSRRFPLSAGRLYTPESASVEELEALHRALHTDRVVIVQPSVYGTDNACMLDAVRRIGPTARGIAVIDEATPDTLLDQMDSAGVRGIRINLATAGVTDPAVGRQRFQSAVERIGYRKWLVQIYTQPPVIDAIKEQIMAAPIPVVFDHFGGAQASLGVRQPGFDALLSVVQTGKAYVKLSAPYRSSTQGPDYRDVTPLAKALIAANPQRILWGSDWPHPDSAPVAGRNPTDLAPRLPVDDVRVFNQLAVWAPEAAVRKKILVDNPATLFGF